MSTSAYRGMKQREAFSCFPPTVEAQAPIKWVQAVERHQMLSSGVALPWGQALVSLSCLLGRVEQRDMKSLYRAGITFLGHRRGQGRGQSSQAH